MRSRRCAGFTYMALLFIVAAMGIVLASTGMVWSTSHQRLKEKELLFIGDQFRTAIGTFYERSPGSVKRYPPSLKALLEDDRHLATLRHLRQIYIDPMTLEREWGLVRAPDGGVMGVHSRSEGVPIKVSGFSERNSSFEGAKSYAGWQFIYVPKAPAAGISKGIGDKPLRH
jgi:type II secretory pathway pseudopilin PulG